MATKKKACTLITGASAGIGESLADVFAENGHDLILVARRLDKLKAVAERLKKSQGVKVHCIAADLGTPDGAQKLYDAVHAAGHEVDVLVNNAGVLSDGPFLDVSLADNLQIVSVNIYALVALSHLFGADMRRRRAGHILNLCSISAFQPIPHLATYAASKAFVLSHSEALAIENAEHGVSVTALCPGFVKTDMTAKDDGSHMGLPGVRVPGPREIAEQGYRALMAGKPVYVNGIANRILTTVMSKQPRWATRRMAAALAHKGL